MWEKIKDFIFEKPAGGTLTLEDIAIRYHKAEEFENNNPDSVGVIPITHENAASVYDQWPLYEAAMEHYCPICDQGFKTRGGTKNHKRLKHGAQKQGS